VSTATDPSLFTACQFAREIMPDWEVDDWFAWPPDLFALTSSILTTTGLYRHAVIWLPDLSPPNYPHLNWDGDEGRQLVAGWYEWIYDPTRQLPARLAAWREIVFADDAFLKCANEGRATSPGAPRRSGGNAQGGKEEASSCRLCHAVLGLHAAADHACRAFGMLANRPEPSVLKFLANFHLAVAGTLSRIPKRHGIVLPKSRTPQRGLTIRSFSHNLTFHRSEVAVQWRAIPWVNREDNENTINILTVPLPLKVDATDFTPVDNPNSEAGARNYHYFAYRPDEDLPEETIRSLLNAASREVRHLHAIVFPELALDWSGLARVKEMVLDIARKAPHDHQLPLIITGIRGPAGREVNQIVLSTFLLNRWYDLVQDKHHRWKLTAPQIRQYSLSGALSVRNQWWEAAPLPARRLTFLVPNGWLSLCPLICEDLAQLEPVSDIIRGVGPTLVLATLMDGPQLPHRWAARYVGVLADDPGSSTLTVTSLGMARRYWTDGQKEEDTTAAMWKDDTSGHRPIRFDGTQGALLTLNAEWKEEFTADGRSDGQAAAVFVLQNVKMLTARSEDELREARQLDEVKSFLRKVPQLAEMTQLEAFRKIRDENAKRALPRTDSASEGDIVEITCLCNLAEAALDASLDDLERLRTWALLQESDNQASRYAPTAGDLYRRIRAEWGQRGRSKARGEEYRRCVAALIEFLMRQNAGETYLPPQGDPPREWFETSLRIWDATRREASKTFADAPTESDEWRVQYLAYYAVLWAVHNRVVRLKLMLSRSGVVERGGIFSGITALLRDVEGALEVIERAALQLGMPRRRKVKVPAMAISRLPGPRGDGVAPVRRGPVTRAGEAAARRKRS
jgi:hypothetical protein